MSFLIPCTVIPVSKIYVRAVVTRLQKAGQGSSDFVGRPSVRVQQGFPTFL